MINNPKDIQEVLNAIDTVTFEQLDEAIQKTDKFFENEESDHMNIFNLPDEEFEDYLVNNIDNADPKILLKQLMNNGLEFTDIEEIELPIDSDLDDINVDEVDMYV
jgi:hypothetical protein